MVAVEGTLRLADDDTAEPPTRVAQRGKQLRRPWPSFPRERAGCADVEVLGDDGVSGGLDETAGARELPVAGCLRVLLVFGGHSSIEGEFHLDLREGEEYLSPGLWRAASRTSRSSAAATPGVITGS
ncbi:hypothetical protein AAH979_02380 [Plantactinospora sp. ZYX-F-223]